MAISALLSCRSPESNQEDNVLPFTQLYSLQTSFRLHLFQTSSSLNHLMNCEGISDILVHDVVWSKKHWLIVWEETLDLQQAHCFRTGLWPRVRKTDANATWEATDPLEGNTAIKRSCPEKSRVFKQSTHISNTVCPKHTYVLANCAYAIKYLNLAQVKSQLEGIYLNDPSGGVQPPDSASGV